MTDSYVQVQPNSTGAKVRVNEVTDDNGDLVEQQVVQLADALGAELAVVPGTSQTTDDTQGLMVQGLVNDSPPQTYIQDEIRPLSITSDGRLRVSTEPGRTHVPFFRDEEEMLWGQGPSMTPDSPWRG